MLQLFQDYFAFVQDNILLIAGTIIVTFLWLFSGCTASTIAELRKHGPLRHLFLGLLIPYAYPLVIFFTMPVKRGTGKEEEVAETARAEGAPPPKKMGNVPGAAGDELGLVEEPAEPEAEWTPARFKEMATDLEGNPRGPFMFLLTSGAEQRAERILDALPMAVVIEIVDYSEKLQRLRIPYAEIENCTEL